MNPILDLTSGTIFVGGGGEGYTEPQNLLLKYANRHGLIAGATGTGKTVTLQTLAESLSLAGVPVFMADIKSDLSGMAAAGGGNPKLADAFAKRSATIGAPLDYQPFPVTFWDVFGEKGHPIRATPAEMGPLLLSRLMGLSEAQEGVLNIAFRVADEQGLALLDLEDIQAMLLWVGQNAKELTLKYGNVSSASVGAIQRALLVLENEGGKLFFGEPALDLADLMRVDASGKGVVNILAADRLMNSPRLYSTFLLWLLSELFEQLPEVGDPDKPKMAFFFDEAHLLFDDAPPALVTKIEQVARLIRSKGVSVWLITQNPADVPEAILGQLGNRVQHALRAFTARDQKALRMAAENYRPNPAFDTAQAIQEVGTGEAITSFLEDKGIPGMVRRTLIRPPLSQVGPITDEQRGAIVTASTMEGKYRQPMNRESAQEILSQRMEAVAASAEQAKAVDDLFKMDGPGYKAPRATARAASGPTLRAQAGDSILTTLGKQVGRQLLNDASRQITRSILGGILRR